MPLQLTLQSPALLIAVGVGVVTAVGCGTYDDAARSAKRPAGQAESAPISKIDPSASASEGAATGNGADRPARLHADDFQLVDAAGLESRIRQFGDAVVLVDCWALWCPHCLEQMPHTLALAERHREAGLVVVGLNFDPPDDPQRRAAAAEFLNDLGADFPQWQSSIASGVQAMDEFGIDSGLPHYRLYDAGRLLTTFDGVEDGLDQAVAEAVRAKGDEHTR